MVAHPLKIRLKAGDNEIELEGERDDVNQLLEKWWENRLFIGNQGSGNAKPAAKTKRVSKRSQPQLPKNEGEDTFDGNDLANQIKDDDRFDVFEHKVIHVSGDWYNKAAFVLWLSEHPLTSGQIRSVLQTLDVRTDLPTISRTLKDNRFIASGQRKLGGQPVAYRLSAGAKSAFEKWLLAEDGVEDGRE
jgi:hypothetical protein